MQLDCFPEDTAFAVFEEDWCVNELHAKLREMRNHPIWYALLEHATLGQIQSLYADYAQAHEQCADSGFDPELLFPELRDAALAVAKEAHEFEEGPWPEKPAEVPAEQRAREEPSAGPMAARLRRQNVEATGKQRVEPMPRAEWAWIKAKYGLDSEAGSTVGDADSTSEQRATTDGDLRPGACNDCHGDPLKPLPWDRSKGADQYPKELIQLVSIANEAHRQGCGNIIVFGIVHGHGGHKKKNKAAVAMSHALYTCTCASSGVEICMYVHRATRRSVLPVRKLLLCLWA